MGKKEKLVYVLHEIAVGGAELAFLAALPRLAEAFDLRVFVLHRGDQNLVNTIPAGLRKYFTFCNVRLVVFPFYAGSLAVQIARFNPRYLLCSLWRSQVVGSLAKRINQKVLYYPLVHSSIFFHKLDRWASLQAMRRADTVLVDSVSARDFVANTCGVTGKDVVVLSFLTSQTPDSLPDYDFRQPHFVFVGRLHPVKNVSLSVRAIAWLRARELDAQLDIYGRDDGDMATVQQVIAKEKMEPYVRLKGEVLPAKKMELLLGNDYPFYMQLSTNEGMAMSVVEAMQVGKVCVLTAVGEIPHYARDGVSALVVDPSSDENWERSMQRVLAAVVDPDVCQQLSQAAHDSFKGKPLFQDALVAEILCERRGNA